MRATISTGKKFDSWCLLDAIMTPKPMDIYGISQVPYIWKRLTLICGFWKKKMLFKNPFALFWTSSDDLENRLANVLDDDDEQETWAEQIKG